MEADKKGRERKRKPQRVNTANVHCTLMWACPNELHLFTTLKMQIEWTLPIDRVEYPNSSLARKFRLGCKTLSGKYIRLLETHRSSYKQS